MWTPYDPPSGAVQIQHAASIGSTPALKPGGHALLPVASTELIVLPCLSALP